MVFYFTGTGNSKWVAEALGQAFGERLVSITEACKKEKKRYEYTLHPEERIFFVYPVHSWGPAALVIRFISSLTLSGYVQQSIYSICVCGDDCAYTSRLLGKALKKRGLLLTAGYSVTMPNTYVSLPGFDIDDSGVEERKVKSAVARVEFINKELRQRVTMKKFACHEGAVPSLKTYLIRPLFNAFGMSSKPFHATDACTACKRCEKACPVHNITVSDKPTWGNNCTQCLACYHVCPSHAVQYGKATQKKGQYKGKFLQK